VNVKLHRHRWGKWEKPFTFGFTLMQNKTCEICGKRKQRRIGWSPE
jgi:hypothetical protein